MKVPLILWWKIQILEISDKNSLRFSIYDRKVRSFEYLCLCSPAQYHRLVTPVHQTRFLWQHVLVCFLMKKHIERPRILWRKFKYLFSVCLTWLWYSCCKTASLFDSIPHLFSWASSDSSPRTSACLARHSILALHALCDFFEEQERLLTR